jgi:cholest-4-en-3-one 26-monooxygenase
MRDTIDLNDLDRFIDGVPHEWLAWLRREAPLFWHDEPEGPGYWVVTRHADVSAINKDWPRFTNTGGITPQDQGTKQNLVMLEMDPPEQTRYRLLISAEFTPRAVGLLEPMVRAIAREYVSAFAEAGGGDWVTDVAAPIPIRVICELMGVPQEDGQKIFEWSNAVVPNADPEYWLSPERAAEANRSLEEYAFELIARKRREPGDDLTSKLVASRLDGEPLSDSLIGRFVRILVVGGSETTRHLISHMLQNLHEHPAERERVARGEVPSELTVEEVWRWNSPVIHHARHATQDVELHGQKIRKGDRVTLWMASANRDEAAFVRADRFDAGRDPNHHVALGAGGPHFCLGAHLARLEGVALLDELRPLLPRLEVTGPPDRLRSNFFNGIKHLPVRVN